MGGTQDLPPRFPCWCKATYSWGGETKKDLGFIEGDLIEALNAGDGSWWMGRLRRDPRAIGLFPSNFVAVLDESFQPAPNSRNASALAQTPTKNGSPSKNGSTFRKPYQAYEKFGPRASLDGAKEREGTPDSDRERAKKEKSKFRPYASMKTAQAPAGSLKKQGSIVIIPQDSGPRIPAPLPRRGAPRSRSPMPPSEMGASAAPTPTPHHITASRRDSFRARSPQPQYRAASPQPNHRAPSPLPYSSVPSPVPSRSRSPLPSTFHDGSAYPQLLPASRQPSPNPYEQQQYQQLSRASSPATYEQQSYHPSRAPSPAPYDEDDIVSSSPPPPPPAHRVAYQPSRAPSPQPYGHDVHGYSRSGTRTPVAPSPGGSQMTPSPLRDAMNDVMSSLHDMSMYTQSSPPVRAATPPNASNVWSPEAFELVRSHSKLHQRTQSAVGFGTRDRYFDHEDNNSRTPSLPSSRDGPPQLDSYVQRMENQLRHAKSFSDQAPQPPLKGLQHSSSRPTTSSSHSNYDSDYRNTHSQQQHPHMRKRKSAYALGREALNRSYTTKTNATNSTEASSATQSSTSTQLTSASLMSGYSAGGFSATSAGSLARRKFGLGSQRSRKGLSVIDTKSMNDIGSSARSMAASETSSGSGPSYHESHASHNQPVITPTADWTKDPMESAGVLGGLGTPKSAKRSGFFKKMIETAKTTARTGAATARSTIGSASGSRPGSRAGSPTKGGVLGGSTPLGFGGGTPSRPQSVGAVAAADMGLGGGTEWMQVRRDINRSNSLSRREHDERAERCEMLDLPVLRPVDQLHEFVDGDEGLDGLAITEPTDFNTPNLALVDKSTRFIQSVPGMINATTLAQSYVCRPHRTDVQRLRAIFTWVAERITWEEDFEGEIDTRRVIQSKRGCSEEIALLVRDMCAAVGLHAEIIHGYLKSPGEILDLDTLAHPNHWWNAVIVDAEWRIMDCALASPTHPKRAAYSSASSQVAEGWYFLARPLEICYTHIPLLPEQQHIVPPVDHETLIALPCACPTYFRHGVELADFETSMLHLEGLEMVHLHVLVPEDVECLAESEARSFAQDIDGDFFESGDIVRKRAMTQAEWVGGRKRYKIKALLPGDDGQATLKVYAGKRGLMHSVKDNPHSLAIALPLTHKGQNPPYDFVVRHPTPHAQRHDLYVVQPQCARLSLNNTFVFCIRQHPSSLSRFTPDTWGSSAVIARPPSPNPLNRPGSAMSMVSATFSHSSSQPSSQSSSSDASGMSAAQLKPAKLAIQSPSQKIIRLTRKPDHSRGGGGAAAGEADDGGLTTSWETVIKVGEKGTWRALVLADRSARWCVFAEWECV